MPAEIPTRRKKTARQMAEELGISVRTVQRVMAEPRDEFTGRAAAHRAQAMNLREQGMSNLDIAAAMNLSPGTIGSLIHHARRIAREQQQQAETA